MALMECLRIPSGVISFEEPAEALGADSAPRNTTAAPVSKDDLDTAMEALDARHWEDAELLAEEVRRQAAADGDAAREAAALRVVTKAQVRAATGISETPDIEVLEKALKAFALEKNGELVAQAIMQLHSAEIYVAMDRHAEALRFAQQAWSIFQQACTFYESMGDARNAASAACKADKAYKLIKGSQASALNVTLLNTQLADAEERNLQNIKALHTLEEKLLETQSMRDMFFKEAEMYRNELKAALMELKVSRDEKTLLEEDLKQLKAQVVLSSAKASGDPVKVNLGGLCLWRAP